MRGTVKAVDSYFTHVALESGRTMLFNHLAPNATPEALRKPGTVVDIVREKPSMIDHCVEPLEQDIPYSVSPEQAAFGGTLETPGRIDASAAELKAAGVELPKQEAKVPVRRRT